jgi:hypothetical protein
MKLWNSPGQRRGAQLVRNKNENIHTEIIFPPGFKICIQYFIFSNLIFFSFKSRQKLIWIGEMTVLPIPEPQNSFLALRRSDQPPASSISQIVEIVRTC